MTAIAIAMALGGCASTVSYAPRPGGSLQAVSAARGIGTLSERDAEGRLLVAPSFGEQRSDEPTFTVVFTNTSAHAVVFGSRNIRAFFRGQPVALATRSEQVADWRADDIAGQIAIVILGGVAIVAALYGLSQPAVAWRDTGVGRVRVNEATDGFLAAVAVGALAEVGLQQIDGTPRARAAAAGAILVERIVPPQGTLAGQLILRDCCDRSVRDGDVVRFEIALRGRVTAFEFVRTAPGAWAPALQAVVEPAAAPVQVVEPVAGIAPPVIGQDAFSAERLARTQGCQAPRGAALADKGAGYERYTLACTDGHALAIRCEFGNCRALP